MSTMDVRLPDGTIVRGVPDTITKAELVAKLKGNGMQVPDEWLSAAPVPERASVGGSIGRDIVAGAVRGAGSIGATALAPVDWLARKAGISNAFIGRTDRRQAMDDALGDLGADTGSFAYKGGKLAAEIAGTAGAGGALMRGVGAVAPGAAAAFPALADAVTTAGMSAGKGLTLAQSIGTRAAGGAISGGAAAAMVDPGDAATGAAVGAVAPLALSGAAKLARYAGEGARAVNRSIVQPVFTSPEQRAGADLLRALDLKPEQLPAVIAKLRGAQPGLPGSSPTVAQVLTMPQASILERVVGAGPGGERLRQQLVAQAEARMSALQGVAPIDPNGAAQAFTDTGAAVERFARGADASARAKTSELYQSVPQDEAALYLPDLAPVRDRYFGRGAFTDRGPADKAVQTAQGIGFMQVPAARAESAGRSAPTLAQAVRQAGGLSAVQHDGLRGELMGLRGDLKNLVRTGGGGLSPGRMAERMYEAGYIPSEDSAALFSALRDDATGMPQYSVQHDMTRAYSAARDAASGGVPGAQAIPQKVTLAEFDNLRKSIGIEQRSAVKAGNSTLAKALGDMKQAMDDRINQVVAGDGAIDENLPIEWANALDAARKSKVDQVQRFRTGPQAGMFSTGSDGMPMKQGGEVAAAFWGNRPGLADDVKSFKRLIGDNPGMLGQFRSMVITQGAEKAASGGVLGQKFVDWTRNMLPGLREAFGAREVETLQRIAADIERASAAAKLGIGPGSNTYQNASNALRDGMLDSPALNGLLSRLPGGRYISAGAGALAEKAGDAKAKRLAGLLADPDAAAAALSSQQRGPVSQAAAGAAGIAQRGLLSDIPWLDESLRDLLSGVAYRAPSVAAAGGDR